jgi:folate-binding protein YgfZ
MRADHSQETPLLDRRPNMDTPLLAEHLAEGARVAEFAGSVLPETFSEFTRECRAARESVAIFDTNWHAIVMLAGRDRVKYLHAITSNNINELREQTGLLALLLNPQGRILAELEVYALLDRLLVHSHASVRERTVATLKKYILGSQVQLEDLTDQLGSIAIEGPRAPNIVAQTSALALGGLSDLAFVEVAVDGVPCRMIRRSHFGSEGVELIAPREQLALLWKNLRASVHTLGGLPIGMKALNALRLEAGMPWFPADFNDSVIPHEAVLENTHISFSKGCYTGQEIVERVRSRGHVNRKRISLTFSTSEPPAPGTKLRALGAEVGYVTSSALSPTSGRAIGMGYLRREHTSAGSVVEFADGTAKVS